MASVDVKLMMMITICYMKDFSGKKKKKAINLFYSNYFNVFNNRMH